MTSGAISLSHRFGMRLVAVNTVRDVAVSICVTEGTGKSCVRARAGNHLLVRTGVTRDADDLMLAFKTDIQRLMRIVAAKTVFNFIVSTTLVTVSTAGDIVFHSGPMPFVTGLAINFCFVRRTTCSDLRRLFIMALGTIINGQYSLPSQGN